MQTVLHNTFSLNQSLTLAKKGTVKKSIDDNDRNKCL